MSEVQPQRVYLGDIPIWKNRKYSEWHRPFPDQVGPMSGCFNANCPAEYHVFGLGMHDPAARPFLQALKSGMRGQRMLIQEDYCGQDHVQYLTYNNMHTHGDGTKELIFREGSRECYRYVRPRPGNLEDEHQATFGVWVFWSALRYAALFDSPSVKAFSVKGGGDEFVKRLAGISGRKLDQVEEKITQLDALNAPDFANFRMRVPPNTYISDIDGLVRAGNTELLLRTLENVAERKPGHIAAAIGVLTQQGRFGQFLELAQGWNPTPDSKVRAGLLKFASIYNQEVPGSQDQTAQWLDTWAQAFNFLDES